MMGEINLRTWRGVLGFIIFFFGFYTTFGISENIWLENLSWIKQVGEGQLKNPYEENTQIHDKD